MSRVSAPTPGQRRVFANSDFSFYNREGYFRDLRKRIAATASGDRITMITMSFQATDQEIALVLHALCQAARRGAAVTLVVDAHDFIVGPHELPGPLLFRKRLPDHMPAFFRHNLQALQRLEASGGRYAIINVPGRPLTLSVAGRSHIKHTIINDRLYIGSSNLDDHGKLEFMTAFESRQLAEYVRNLTERIIREGNTREALSDADETVATDDKTSLLIDAGRPKQSLILTKALGLIDEAEASIYMTCQFFPNSRTLEHLRRAYRRGVQISLLFNAPSKHPFPWNLLHYSVLSAERLRTPPALTAGQLPKTNKYLHAKLLASEKSVIIGSHNFVVTGVSFGTAEIALLRHDEAFARLAVQVMQDQLVM